MALATGMVVLVVVAIGQGSGGDSGGAVYVEEAKEVRSC